MKKVFPGGLAVVVVATALLAGVATAARDDVGTRQQPVQRGGNSAQSLPARLVSTEWRLVEFQSMDDAVGTVRPKDPSLFTMRLNADSTVTMRLDCNRANGTWSAQPISDGSSGRFEFGPLAATRALCPPPHLDERVTAQAPHVRSFLLKDGRLHLSLMADGGIFVWEPQTEIPFETVPDKDLEAAILNASPSYTRDAVGTDRARYVYGRADLNDDGRDEVFVYMLGSIFCGSGGCDLLLFTGDTKVGYRLVNRFPISRLPIVVSASKTAGWHDLFRPESGGGAKASYLRHAFDGKKYVERERTPADEPPAGRRFLAGELSFEKGIPLEPRSDRATTAAGPVAPPPSKTGFATVCGVTASGKEYRYRCTVEGAAPGTTGSTVLHFPDNTVALAWLGGNKATATFAGMVPKPITFSTAGGTTRFTFEDRVYFFVSDRAAAAAALGTLRK